MHSHQTQYMCLCLVKGIAFVTKRELHFVGTFLLRLPLCLQTYLLFCKGGAWLCSEEPETSYLNHQHFSFLYESWVNGEQTRFLKLPCKSTLFEEECSCPIRNSCLIIFDSNLELKVNNLGPTNPSR